MGTTLRLLRGIFNAIPCSQAQGPARGQAATQQSSSKAAALHTKKGAAVLRPYNGENPIAPGIPTWRESAKGNDLSGTGSIDGRKNHFVLWVGASSEKTNRRS